MLHNGSRKCRFLVFIPSEITQTIDCHYLIFSIICNKSNKTQKNNINLKTCCSTYFLITSWAIHNLCCRNYIVDVNRKVVNLTFVISDCEHCVVVRCTDMNHRYMIKLGVLLCF